MSESAETHNETGAALDGIPTIFPPSPPLEERLDRFWEVGPEFDRVQVTIAPPDTPLAILEQLGPSPFERGGFPLIGFLASTYDRVSQSILDRM